MQDLTYNLDDIEVKFVLMFEESSTNWANLKRNRNLATKGYPMSTTGPSNNLFCYCKANSLVETNSNVTIIIQTSSQNIMKHSCNFYCPMATRVAKRVLY